MLNALWSCINDANDRISLHYGVRKIQELRNYRVLCSRHCPFPHADSESSQSGATMATGGTGSAVVGAAAESILAPEMVGPTSSLDDLAIPALRRLAPKVPAGLTSEAFSGASTLLRKRLRRWHSMETLVMTSSFMEVGQLERRQAISILASGSQRSNSTT